MVSPAQQHWDNHQAAAQPVAAGTHGVSKAMQEQYRLMFMRQQTDLIYLRAIRSREGRNQRKRELLPNYVDYLSAVINSGKTTTDTVLVQCCIWALDVQQFGLCLTLADYAIQHRMDSPVGFTRTVPEILLEELAYIVNHADEPGTYAPYLLTLQEMTEGLDILDEIKAKFFKALGAAQSASQPAAALLAYQQAARLGAKVQTQIKKLDIKDATK